MSRSLYTKPQNVEEPHSQTEIQSKPLSTIRHRRRQLETTSAACRKSKEQRSKRPDSLGPCKVCENNECFYYFNPKSKKGREDSLDPSTIRWRQKCLLDNFLFVMRSGSEESIDELLEIIDEDRMGSKTMHCIWKHVITLKELIGGGSDNVSMRKASSEKLVKPEISNSNSSPQTQDLGRSNGQIFTPPPFAQASSTSLVKSDTSGERIDSIIKDLPLPRTVSEVHAALSAPKPTPTGGYGRAEEKPTISLPAGSHPTSSCTRAVSEPVRKSHRLNSLLSAQEEDLHVSVAFGSVMGLPSFCSANMSDHFGRMRVLDIPILEPATDFSNLCVYVRNSSREALATGTGLGFLSNWGRMDCELLFRDRVDTDLWHIPNWACEVSRRLPRMSAATRLAFALCLYRMMIFLIAPSEKTLSQLPHILRPTDHQMRVPHDITFNFIPLPQMRSSLVYKPADWLTILVLHNLRVNWTGEWGDVGGSVMSEHGLWHSSSRDNVASHSCQSQGARSDASARDTQQQSSVRTSALSLHKAIVYDAQSNGRYISPEFERHCWTQENWSVSKEILKSWPELEGHIAVF